MKYLQKYEGLAQKYKYIEDMINCFRQLEPDGIEMTFSNNYWNIYNINFEFDGVTYDAIKIYKIEISEMEKLIKDFIICRVGERDNYDKVMNKPARFINALYKYLRDNYDEYFNAIDMGLL
jgi:hypothetical protein